MTVAVGMIWKGAEDLRAHLQAVEDLEPHPHDPRRGDREEVADSLGRFGQLKPIVVDRDGTILAGSQIHAAAVERLGWTHVAVVIAEHLDEVDAYLYLLADNRASDMAGYDDREATVAADGVRGLAAEAEATLETETDQSERDRLAERIRALNSAADVLEDHASRRRAGGIVDPDAIEASFRCLDPNCAYEWRGAC